MEKKLWEILVPVEDRNGDAISVQAHQRWDQYVRKTTGGLTVSSGLAIFKTNKGYWESPSGRVDVEKVIPVRILCTREQIEKIADYTAGFYFQEAVMFYCIAEEVVIKHYPEPVKKDIPDTTSSAMSNRDVASALRRAPENAICLVQVGNAYYAVSAVATVPAHPNQKWTPESPAATVLMVKTA